MKKIKILFVEHTPFLGGLQLWLSSHLKYLDKENFSVGVVTSQSSLFHHIYRQPSVKIYPIRFETLKNKGIISFVNIYKTVVDLNRVIKQVKPDLVITNTPRALIAALSYRGNLRLISILHSYDYPKFLIDLAKFRVAKFITISEAVKRFYNLQDENSQTVLLGADFKFRPDKDQIELFRKKLGIHKSDLVIGFVGRLVYLKGPQILLDAFLRIKNKNLKLIFFGSGQDQQGNFEAILKAKIKASRLEKKIKVVGFIEDKNLIYSLIDILVLPTLTEGFGIVLLEAATAGVSIVATNVGGIPEFIRNQENGLLVEPGDSSKLKAALIRLIKDKKLRESLEQKASLNAKNLSIKNSTKRLEKIYESCLSS